jgi:AraC-like DNA-binding protein
MKTFEYKTVEIKPVGKWIAKYDFTLIDQQINELGKSGWELVSVVSKNVGYGSTESFIYTFKRAI